MEGEARRGEPLWFLSGPSGTAPSGQIPSLLGNTAPSGKAALCPALLFPQVQRLSAESAGNSSPGRSCGVGSAVPPGFSTASSRARRPCRLPSPAPPRNGLRWVWPPGVPASKRGGWGGVEARPRTRARSSVAGAGRGGGSRRGAVRLAGSPRPAAAAGRQRSTRPGRRPPQGAGGSAEKSAAGSPPSACEPVLSVQKKKKKIRIIMQRLGGTGCLRRVSPNVPAVTTSPVALHKTWGSKHSVFIILRTSCSLK